MPTSRAEVRTLQARQAEHRKPQAPSPKSLFHFNSPQVVSNAVNATIGTASARSVRPPSDIRIAPESWAAATSDTAQPPSGPTIRSTAAGLGIACTPTHFAERRRRLDAHARAPPSALLVPDTNRAARRRESPARPPGRIASPTPPRCAASARCACSRAIAARLISDRSLTTGRMLVTPSITASRTTSSILSPLSTLTTSDEADAELARGHAGLEQADRRGFLSDLHDFCAPQSAAAVEDVDFVADAQPQHAHEVFGFVLGQLDALGASTSRRAHGSADARGEYTHRHRCSFADRRSGNTASCLPLEAAASAASIWRKTRGSTRKSRSRFPTGRTSTSASCCASRDCSPR